MILGTDLMTGTRNMNILKKYSAVSSSRDTFVTQFSDGQDPGSLSFNFFFGPKDKVSRSREYYLYHHHTFHI